MLRPLADGGRPPLDLGLVAIDLPVAPLTPPRGPARLKRQTPATVRDAVAPAGTRAALVGPAGSGKSTTLHSLAYGCVASTARLLPENWLGAPPVPLLLDGRTLAATIEAGVNGAAGCWPWIRRSLEQQSLAHLLPAVEAALAQGCCLALVDNFDQAHAEASGPALLELSRLLGQGRLLVATRDAGWLGDALLKPWRLLPLDLPQMDQAIGLRLEGRAAAAGLALDEPTRQQAVRFQAALRANDELRGLAAQPGLLARCLEPASLELALPLQQPRLYQQLLDGLLGVPAEELPQLALVFCQQEADGLPHGLPEREIVALGIGSTLLDACVQSGVLQCDEAGSYCMPQQALRSYLAARALLPCPDMPAILRERQYQATWWPVLRLLANMLSAESQTRQAAALLQELLDCATTPEKRQRSVILAAELLLELHDAAPFVSLIATARSALVALLAQPLLPLAGRVRAGRALGHLGDPRTATLLSAMLAVPAGPCLLGDDHGGYADEGPMLWIELPPFAMGQHPVTNHEYARFLAAYPDYQQPHYWHDPEYNNPSQPVVGVTWHDALTYCSWLTGELRRRGELDPAQVVRLPREAEWERVAAWDAAQSRKQLYPWGDTWDSARANTADGRGNWTVAPIGCLPEGISPTGAHDMIGNVWEWTLDEYRSYPGAARLFYEPRTYVLRGSSCQSLPSNARCTFRNRLPPGYWRSHIGFRLVLAAAPETPL